MNTELIKQAKVDPEAFGELYEEFYDALYGYVYLRVNKQALVEDLVAQVWEKVLTHLRSLKSDAPEAFRAWIFTIARNAIAEHFRGHQESALPENWDTIADDDPAIDAKSIELGDAIALALQGLPPLDREIMSLKIFADLSNKQISQELNKPEKTIAAYISRSLKHIQKRLSFYSPSI